MTNLEVSVVPTQADRHMAQNLERHKLEKQHGRVDWIDDVLRPIGAGQNDEHPTVQMFARHRLAHQTPPATQPSATVGEVSDAELKDMTAELLSHRGERPYRILRGGTALWETWLPAMRAALRYLPATLHTPPPVATATVVDATNQENDR